MDKEGKIVKWGKENRHAVGVTIVRCLLEILDCLDADAILGDLNNSDGIRNNGCYFISGKSYLPVKEERKPPRGEV